MKPETVTPQNMEEFVISREDFFRWATAFGTELPPWTSYNEPFEEDHPWKRLSNKN